MLSPSMQWVERQRSTSSRRAATLRAPRPAEEEPPALPALQLLEQVGDLQRANRQLEQQVSVTTADRDAVTQEWRAAMEEGRRMQTALRSQMQDLTSEVQSLRRELAGSRPDSVLSAGGTEHGRGAAAGGDAPWTRPFIPPGGASEKAPAFEPLPPGAAPPVARGLDVISEHRPRAQGDAAWEPLAPDSPRRKSAVGLRGSRNGRQRPKAAAFQSSPPALSGQSTLPGIVAPRTPAGYRQPAPDAAGLPPDLRASVGARANAAAIAAAAAAAALQMAPTMSGASGVSDAAPISGRRFSAARAEVEVPRPQPPSPPSRPTSAALRHRAEVAAAASGAPAPQEIASAIARLSASAPRPDSARSSGPAPGARAVQQTRSERAPQAVDAQQARAAEAERAPYVQQARAAEQEREQARAAEAERAGYAQQARAAEQERAQQARAAEQERAQQAQVAAEVARTRSAHADDDRPMTNKASDVAASDIAAARRPSMPNEGFRQSRRPTLTRRGTGSFIGGASPFGSEGLSPKALGTQPGLPKSRFSKLQTWRKVVADVRDKIREEREERDTRFMGIIYGPEAPEESFAGTFFSETC